MYCWGESQQDDDYLQNLMIDIDDPGARLDQSVPGQSIDQATRQWWPLASPSSTSPPPPYPSLPPTPVSPSGDWGCFGSPLGSLGSPVGSLGYPPSRPPSVTHTVTSPVTSTTSPLPPNDDLSLAQAALTPLIKEELKSCIKKRRAENGLGDILLEVKPESSEELTEADLERRRRRKESNRRAAEKCRQKKKKQAAEINNRLQELSKENINLKEQMEKLKSDKQKLKEFIVSHLRACPMGESIRRQLHRHVTSSASS